MRKLGIGEVCKLLDIRAHVLRYWEQAIPFFDPEKNTGGRRVYGETELNLLYRLKYLIQQRRFTLEGAALALVDESASAADMKARIHVLRKDILDVRSAAEEMKARCACRSSEPVFFEGQEHLSRIWRAFPPDKRKLLYDDLLALPRGILDLTLGLGASSHEAVYRPVRLFRRVDAEDLATGRMILAEDALSSGTLSIVTLLPENRPMEKLTVYLGRLAAVIREASYVYGKSFYWYLFCPSDDLSGLRERLRLRDYFGMDPKRVVFVREPRFPLLDTEGRLLVSPSGRLFTKPTGHLGALMMLGSSALKNHFQEKNIRTLVFLPLNGFSLGFPDLELLQLHFSKASELSLTCTPSPGGGCRTTGLYLADTELFSGRSNLIGTSPKILMVKAVNRDSASADDIRETEALKHVSGPYRLIEKAVKRQALLEPIVRQRRFT